MRMKYIVGLCREFEDGRWHELPIMFPQALVHKEMAEQLTRIARKCDLMLYEIVGAGFCYVGDGEVVCEGRSESLSIKSRGALDTAAFARCNSYESGTQIAPPEKYDRM